MNLFCDPMLGTLGKIVALFLLLDLSYPQLLYTKNFWLANFRLANFRLANFRLAYHCIPENAFLALPVWSEPHIIVGDNCTTTKLPVWYIHTTTFIIKILPEFWVTTHQINTRKLKQTMKRLDKGMFSF